MKNIKDFNEYIKEEFHYYNDGKPTVTMEEIEKKGNWVNDYTVDGYDEIEDAGLVNIYSYKGFMWYIVTWKPESERGSIGKELLTDLTKPL
jgi:ABC-type Fe3+-hydroxamate transport system substrate-binding protein